MSWSFVVGLVIGILLGAVLGTLAVILSGAEREPTTQQIFVPITLTPLPEVSPTPDLRPRARIAATVRSGPSGSGVALGVVSRGAILQPIGRNQAGDWLAIRYPAGSTSTGWVLVADVEGVSNPADLAIMQPTPVPFVAAPPSGFTTDQLTAGPTLTASATPQPLPDLVVTDVSLLPDGRVSARIGNIGGSLLDGFIFVRFSNTLGEAEVVKAPQTILPAGSVITIISQTFHAKAGDTVRVTANPSGDVRESNGANNSRDITVPAPAVSSS